MTKECTAAFRAWGYFTAAARGEIEPYVSQQRVEDWIDTTPWGMRMVGRFSTIGQYNQWRKEMAKRMVHWLEEFAVEEEVSR